MKIVSRNVEVRQFDQACEGDRVNREANESGEYDATYLSLRQALQRRVRSQGSNQLGE